VPVSRSSDGRRGSKFARIFRTSADTAQPINDVYELGWADVVTDDRATALHALFDIKGETRSSVPVLDVVLSDRLADLVGDDALRGASFAFGTDLTMRPAGKQRDTRLDVAAVVLSQPTAPVHVVVPVAVVDGPPRLGVLPLEPDALHPVAGMDPSLGLSTVVTETDADAVTWLPSGAEAVLDELVTLARLALSAELDGLSRSMLGDAVQYACDRRQYGRPIGSFQALQHRLADAHAAIVGASGVVAEAFTHPSPWAATVAKALAGRAFEDASRQCQQAFGAIGFTWEHDFHWHLRRGYVLDALAGDWRSLQLEVGERLLATGVVPRVGELRASRQDSLSEVS
jgi:hypothetical protein